MKTPPEFLYHGTTTNYLESIKKHGLLPSRPSKWQRRFRMRSAVFFADSVKRAKTYAVIRRYLSGFPTVGERYELFESLWRRSYRQRQVVILRVKTSVLSSCPIPDYVWKIFGELGQWVYFARVPPEQIEVLINAEWGPIA